MIFVGIDWSEHQHDVCVLDAGGSQLASVRVPEGIEGVVRLHEVLADPVRTDRHRHRPVADDTELADRLRPRRARC